MPLELSPGVFQVGNTSYNTNYADSARGKAEALAETRAEAMRRLQDLKDATQHQSQQDAFDVSLSVEDRAQRQELAQSTIEALSGLTPLAAAGAVDDNVIRQVTGRAVSDTLSQQRIVRTAAKDMDTLLKLRDNGTHNEQQTAKALQAMEREYGGGIMRRVPGYAQMAGVEQQVEQEKIELRQQFAKQNGIPEHLVKFNDETFEPEFNAQGAAIEIFKTNQQDSLAEREDKVWRRQMESKDIKLSSLHKQMTTLAAQINGIRKGHQQPHPNDIKRYNALSEAYFAELEGIGAASGSRPTPMAEVAPTSTAKTFSSRAEATAAMKAGMFKNNDRLIIEGVPAMYVNGAFQKVN